MTKRKQINNIWLKASVLGCLWASSEIVLGSFLHNLRIPFTGNILTAVGIILLISVAHIWKEKGLFWRAGLVCALMKSISPSAIIFGPMIAIFCESLLMELSVRIFRRNIFSFLLAGILAMSWNLVQVILNYIIIYGTNIIDLYINLTKFAQNQLHIINNNFWMPILILLSLYIILGLIAAIFGIIIGKKATIQPSQITNLSVAQVMEIKSKKTETTFNFSIYWLFFNIIFLIIELSLMSFMKWQIWISSGIILLLIWSFRYKKSLRPLAKPKFWLFFMLLTLLSAYILYILENSEDGAIKGILIGLEMNFRAAVTIIGFSTIGTELRNPLIRLFFINSNFRQLPLALEVAFDSLPYTIANLPHLQNIFRSPVKVFHEFVSQIDFWLAKVEFKIINNENIIIIRGTEKTGKSTLLFNIVETLKQNNIKVGGFICPSVKENDMLVGHDLLDIYNNKKVVLSRLQGNEKMAKVGNFFFNNEGIACGKKALNIVNFTEADVVIIDEVGPWELKNQGWAESINHLVKSFNKPMIWVVRESIVDKVIDNWSLQNPLIIDIKEKDTDAICAFILSDIRKKLLNQFIHK